MPSCFLFLTLYPVLSLSFSPLIQSEDNTQFHTRSRRQQQQQNDPNYLVFSPDDDISSDEEDPDAGDENDDGGGGEKKFDKIISLHVQCTVCYKNVLFYSG